MDLSESSLTELVAELRERLRRFASGPPGQAAATTEPGPLNVAGRAALASRLLAVVLQGRQGRQAARVARALQDLAKSLDQASAPLPGSSWETDLRSLASQFESLAAAWDQDDGTAQTRAWTALKRAGDHLWAEPPADAAAPAATNPSPKSPAPVESVPDVALGPIWLLVGGVVRRQILCQKLELAGLKVDCLEDAADVANRLDHELPAALVCDDAAPTRYCSHLRSILPAESPPLILVRSRDPGLEQRTGPVWLPPYRTEDLLSRLTR
jgi:hypothetical protein